MAVNVDVAEVEAQLAALRARRNGLLAQRAVAHALTVLLIAATIIVTLALHGSPGLFSGVTATVALVAVAAVAYCAWQAWTGWLSLSATARFADTTAALDDRLTTLIGTALIDPGSTLRPLLVAQLLGARGGWTADALAPQRVARAVALVPAAAMLFAAVTFYGRPPGAPTATPRRADRTASFPAGPMDDAREKDVVAEAELFTKPAGEQRPSSTTGRTSGDGPNAASADNAPDADKPIADRTGDGATLAAAPTDGGAGPLASLQDSIRQAFGAAGPNANSSRSGPPQEQNAGGAKPEHDRPGSDSQAAGDSQTASARHQQAAPEPGQPSNPDAATTKSGGAHGSGRGGAGASAAGTMFGDAQARGPAADAAPMAIKLSAISGVSPSKHEPQRGAADVPAVPTNAARTGGPLPDMATTQLADAAIQKLDVGPEYEGVVRRLFARQ